jgi:RNA polymerase sigma-70 factor (ECF subfamily)
MNHVKTSEASTEAIGWLERHGDALYRYALLRLRSSHAAEDVVQEALLAGLSQQSGGAAGAFAGRSTERTWLMGILRHKLLDRLRRDAREAPPSGQPSPRDGETFDEFFDNRGKWRIKPAAWRGLPADDPHALLERTEFRNALVRCLEAIPRRLSRAFILREADGVEPEEIRGIMGLSETGLWTLLYRARLRLRQCLGASGFGEKQRPAPAADERKAP